MTEETHSDGEPATERNSDTGPDPLEIEAPRRARRDGPVPVRFAGSPPVAAVTPEGTATDP